MNEVSEPWCRFFFTEWHNLRHGFQKNIHDFIPREAVLNSGCYYNSLQLLRPKWIWIKDTNLFSQLTFLSLDSAYILLSDDEKLICIFQQDQQFSWTYRIYTNLAIFSSTYSTWELSAICEKCKLLNKIWRQNQSIQWLEALNVTQWFLP